MNKIFKVIWNRRTQSWVAVPEVTKAQGKTKSSTVMLVAALLTAGAVALGGGQASANITIQDGQNLGTGNATATGSGYSNIAIGWGANTSAVQGIAIGNEAKATGRMSTAISSGATASGAGSIAIGGKMDQDSIFGPEGTSKYYNQAAQATGKGAIALGVQNTASGEATVAIGVGSTASGRDTVAIGLESMASGIGSLAIGTGNKATGESGQDAAIAIGEGNTAKNSSSAWGRKSEATGLQSYAAGTVARALNAHTVAIGPAVSAKGNSAIAIGSGTTAESEASVAIGINAWVAGGTQKSNVDTASEGSKLGVAIGNSARVKASVRGATFGANSNVENSNGGTALGARSSVTNAVRGTAIGIGATTSNVTGGVALGAFSNANRAALNETTRVTATNPTVANNEVYALSSAGQREKAAIEATVKGGFGAVSVGGTVKDTLSDGTVVYDGTATRQIINVAAGSEDSDAVNVAQLKAVANVAESKIGDNTFALGGNNNTTTATQALSKTGGLKFNVVGANNGSYITTTAANDNVTVDLSDDAKAKLNRTVTVEGSGAAKVTSKETKDSAGRVTNTTYTVHVDPVSGGATSTEKVVKKQ